MEADPRLQQAHELSKAGQHNDAIQLFNDTATSADEATVQNAKLGIGVALIRAERFKDAGDFLLGCGVEVPEIYLNACEAYRRIDDFEGAAKSALSLVKLRYKGNEAPYRHVANWASKVDRPGLLYEMLLAIFEINSEDLSVVTLLADTCKKLKKLKQSVTFLLKAYELATSEDQVRNIAGVLAGIYKDCAEQPKALANFRKAYEMKPEENACSNLIMAMQYTNGVGFIEFYNQCREYGARFLTNLPRHVHTLNRLDGERAATGLRIGFVSGDFIAHSLANLLLEPFKQFKPQARGHQLFIYSSRESERRDEISRQYHESVHEWRDIHGMSHAEAAQLIYEDRIDVLVEIAGHTAYNRLPIFGYKPAPVQVGWVSGMMTPPGIDTINYFLTDKWIRPPAAKHCFEELIDLPAAYCYFPLATPPPVGPLPARANRCVTFGSFNNPCKISDEVLWTWAACLKAVPNSRMHIKVYSTATEYHFRKFFVDNGVSDTRITFVYHLPTTEAVMTHYNEHIDLVLDTWPCAGCLTSAEAMWSGSPVMTLTGDTFLHRQTWTILCQLGLEEELGASTKDEFISKTRELCENLDRLEELRRTMRERMEAAPIRDPAAMASGVLDGLEYAWRHWCTSREPLREVTRLTG